MMGGGGNDKGHGNDIGGGNDRGGGNDGNVKYVVPAKNSVRTRKK